MLKTYKKIDKYVILLFCTSVCLLADSVNGVDAEKIRTSKGDVWIKQ